MRCARRHARCQIDNQKGHPVKKPEEFRLAAAAGAALIDIATVSAIAAEVQTATRSNSQGSQTWGHWVSAINLTAAITTWATSGTKTRNCSSGKQPPTTPPPKSAKGGRPSTRSIHRQTRRTHTDPATPNLLVTIVRITGGNFRLVERLTGQVARIMDETRHLVQCLNFG